MAITIPSLTRTSGSGSVTTGKSVTGDGLTTPVELVNDSSAPGVTKYYGTNAAGTRGYYDLPSGSVTLSNLNALSLGTAGPGVSTEVSRYDHRHPMPSAADVGADPAGSASSSMSSHIADLDPHVQYALTSELANVATSGSATDLTIGTLPDGRLSFTVTTFAKSLLDDVNSSDARMTLDLAAIASSGSASDLTVGTLPVARIQDGDISNAKLANMGANTVKARAANTPGVPSDVALSSSQLLGRGSTGDITAITLGTNLSMSGTTLNATGSGGGVTQGQVVAKTSSFKYVMR